MFGLGIMELLLVLALVVFIFGWGRLPQLGGNLRKAIQNVKRMSRGEDEIDVTPIVTTDAERKESHHARHRDG